MLDIELKTHSQGQGANGDIVLSCDTVKTEVNVTLEGSICPTCNGTGH
ncbi:MAG: hypothetical protein J6X70_02415 [Muribaculaceae bacterium]|nr:hypothetical protein [Muribaculaceae bacterium]